MAGVFALGASMPLRRILTDAARVIGCFIAAGCVLGAVVTYVRIRLDPCC